MGWYDHLTIDEDGMPVLTEIATNSPVLDGKTTFDLPKDLTLTQWRFYWEKVYTLYHGTPNKKKVED